MLKLSLRFVLPLLLAVAALAYLSVPLIDRLTLRWFMSDLDQRSQAIAATVAGPLREAQQQGLTARATELLNAAASDERLQSAALCDAQGRMVARSTAFPSGIGCATGDTSAPRVLRVEEGVLHPTRVPIRIGDAGAPAYSMLVLHDMGFIELRSNETRWYAMATFAVLALVVALITVAVAHLSWRGWVRGVRAMLTGEGLLRPFAEGEATVDKALLPLEAEVRSLFRRLERQRAADTSIGEGWSAQRLRAVLQSEYTDDEIIVVSNRQPYSHERRDGEIVVAQPASGLVTALEPVLRAASGTWIAHGSGSADVEVSDRDGCVQVPPEQPAYTLRRLWLTPEEVRGYYEGFANEGLWPLCHIAHVRPVFRAEDWRHFVDVSQRFADAVVKSAKRTDPLVLVQDYHMPLVPQMIRDRLPQATVVTFWHIPWPMSETFGICPWREQILEGLLGSHIIGFQTRAHCRNFIDAVDTFLESRIEHEASTIHRGGQLTRVAPYPISIAWPPAPAEPIEATRARVHQWLGLPPGHRVAVGIDRLDYIKGLIERFAAVEHLLRSQPQWRGRFTLVQVASPSRSDLPEYQAFHDRVLAEAQRINDAYPSERAPAILLRVEHHGAQTVRDLYRSADVAMVTSLHDGMNLVAKEYVAARDDDLGVLLLSVFTGASRELHEALLVNPYSAEETGNALARALAMPPAEQRERMRTMRAWVRGHNIYRWAGSMLIDAARVRSRERVTARIEKLQQRPLKVAV
jgi:trehalose 6-phosphate synthase/phosphatase